MTENTNPPPPSPNPMTTHNPYPRPADGTPNFPLLHATRDLIASLPERSEGNETDGEPGWVQSDWRCGTGMCFAGWAAALTGATFPYSPDDTRSHYIGNDYIVAASAVVVDTNGDEWTISRYALHMLGLDNDNAAATDLFDGGNNLAMIDQIIEDIEDQ